MIYYRIMKNGMVENIKPTKFSTAQILRIQKKVRKNLGIDKN